MTGIFYKSIREDLDTLSHKQTDLHIHLRQVITAKDLSSILMSSTGPTIRTSSNGSLNESECNLESQHKIQTVVQKIIPKMHSSLFV